MQVKILFFIHVLILNRLIIICSVCVAFNRTCSCGHLFSMLLIFPAVHSPICSSIHASAPFSRGLPFRQGQVIPTYDPPVTKHPEQSHIVIWKSTAADLPCELTVGRLSESVRWALWYSLRGEVSFRWGRRVRRVARDAPSTASCVRAGGWHWKRLGSAAVRGKHCAAWMMEPALRKWCQQESSPTKMFRLSRQRKTSAARKYSEILKDGSHDTNEAHCRFYERFWEVEGTDIFLHEICFLK